MDKGFKQEKMCQILKTEQEKHLSLRQAVLAVQWDSVESDTESLAQERAYQQQLQMCIHQNKYILPHKEHADSLQHGDGEEEEANETEEPQIYDSLDEATHLDAKRNPTVLQNEYVDTQIDEREAASGQVLADDAYSDLRYDPNWRTNLMGAGHFNESPQVSDKEYYQVPKEKSSQACGDRQGLVMKGGYRYTVYTSPAVVVTPHMADNQSEQSYSLHPQDGQNSSVISPQCHNHALKLRSPETDLSRPSRNFAKNEHDNTSQRGFRKTSQNSCDDAGENISRAPELTEDLHAMYLQEYKTYYQQELKLTNGGHSHTQHMSTSALSSPQDLSNKKLERLTENIVERNKITLGRNMPKCVSYVMVHAHKQDTPHNVKKVTQISKGKRSQQKEYSNPLQKQQPPALGVRAERGHCLSSPLERPAAVTQPKPQKATSSQPLPPTFHLNINLKASSHLLPLLQQKGQDSITDIASLHWSPASQVEFALSPGYGQTNTGKSSHMSLKGVNAQPHHQNQESSPEPWQRTIASKWPLSCEREDQTWSPDEVHIKEFPQNLPRTPTTTSSLGLGSYTVLPPIEKPMTGKEPELSPIQVVSTAYPIHRSSSDGYLIQMEKQKQLKARVTYKAYSLKDYKQLKSDIHVQGLGPDYKAIEKTAEKMKQQRLYSNVIRERNKKISRIPFLPAKDPEGNDKKVPRMKALEYAKTIAKPPIQSQPKQKHQSAGFIEHTSYLEGLDGSQPATLEVLRKRHEEEKKAVALFRKVHAV
ncbi:jhy protein homolog [Chaetodon auriga]|uniref:jhy protein homolog n=1 Tax=Chaetodon auriga TaxID=39042 RepID=UPI004032FEEB